MSSEIAASRRRQLFVLIALVVLMVLLVPLCLLVGAVDIPFAGVAGALVDSPDIPETWRVIVVEARLPMALTAMMAGAALSVAGLLMQTVFDNPLAGPSILGVSTGASLGVAIVMLAAGGAIVSSLGNYIATISGALAGAITVLVVLLLMSHVVKSTTMLLIVGILTGYLASSAISLLNFFATQEGVHSFVIWGMGSFSGVTLDRLGVLAGVVAVLLLLSMLMVKPLDALLLGSRYARSLGVDVIVTRNRLLFLSGALTAVVTAFCGPIGFIGLVVPHIARMAVATSRHAVLLPATALSGAVLAMGCALVSVLPGSIGVIPVNAITPVVGVPVIIYVIVARKKLHYFN